jgi:DNA-binding PadR family transcriptional regulator
MQVLEAFLAVPDRQWRLIELTRAAMLSGSIVPDLARLIAAGWVTTGLDAQPNPGSRCRRRWYMLTDAGQQALDSQPATPWRRRHTDRAGWWWPRRGGAAARR